MRASMSHKFGRDLGLGTAPWTPHPVILGKFMGNPSLSPKVSQYMVSLQRRKASNSLGDNCLIANDAPFEGPCRRTGH